MEFEEFRAQYELMHPGEKPTPPEPVTEGLFMRIGIGGMFVFSAAISGVHTIPVIYSTIDAKLVDEWIRRAAATGSFFAVEMGILLTGYGISSNRWINNGAGFLAIAVAVVCNVISVAQAFSGGNLGDIAVSLILGVFAPIMALLAGKAFEGQQVRVEAEIERRAATHKADLEVWNEQIAEAYRAEERRLERRVARLQASDASGQADAQTSFGRTAPSVQPSERPAVRPDMDKRSSRAGYGFDRTSDAQQRAIAWFNAHPEQAMLPVRTLEERIGVSKSTISDARKVWLGQQQVGQSTNGNGHVEGTP